MTAGHAQGLAVAALASLAAVFVAGLVLAVLAGGLTGGDLVAPGWRRWRSPARPAAPPGRARRWRRGVRGRDAFLVAIGGALAMCAVVTVLVRRGRRRRGARDPARDRRRRGRRRADRRQAVGRASVP